MQIKIPFFSKYSINDNGEVFRISTGEKISPWVGTTGYLYVRVYHDDGKQRNLAIHKLTMDLLGTEPPQDGNFYIINHIDGNKQNPRLSNLEWVTYSGNLTHAWNEGLREVDSVKIFNGITEMVFANFSQAAKALGLTRHQRTLFMNDGCLGNNLYAKVFSDQTSWEVIIAGNRKPYRREEKLFQIHHLKTKTTLVVKSKSQIRKYVSSDKIAIDRRLEMKTTYPLNGWSIREYSGDAPWHSWTEAELLSHPLRGNIRPFEAQCNGKSIGLFKSQLDFIRKTLPGITDSSPLSRAIKDGKSYHGYCFKLLEIDVSLSNK